MGKILVLVLIAAAAWIGWTIHEQGTDKAFGGILAPLQSVRNDESMGALSLTPAAQDGDLPVERSRDPGRTTQDVRDRLSGSSRRRAP